MLSNVSIQKFLDSKDLIITPWHPEMMRAAGVSLHLGNVILIPKGNQVVDVKLKNVPKYEKVELSDAKPFPLTPNMFVLGETYEMVGLSEHIGMLLEGRSTLARLGITVVQTAMIIDTGMRPKKVTLEIHNKGPHTILLYPKMKFCRACIFHLDPPATIRYDTDGKYHVNDENKPIFNEEFAKE